MRHTFHTGWEALFWKEWRQQRTAALLLGLLCLLGYLGYSAAFRWEPEGMGLMALLVLIAPALGANAFAADEEASAAGFSSWLPIPRGRTVLTKYLVALAAGVACLLPPYLVFLVLCKGGHSGSVFLWDWGLSLLLMGSAVAIAGALTREGLNGMGILLSSGALLGLSLFLGFCNGGGYNAWSVAIPLWAVAHLWLCRAWRRDCTVRRAAWRRAVWPALLVVVPSLAAGLAERVGAVPELLALLRVRVFDGPGTWARNGKIMASPSPDGRFVAVGTRRDGASATWLLDVGTGRIKRMGSRWQECYLDVPVPNPTCWSPDGSQLRIFSHPMAWLGRTPDTVVNEAVETMFDIDNGRARPARRRPVADFGGFVWLGDGTAATWSPDAWEFTDGTGASLGRCRHSQSGTAGPKRFWRVFWTDHAIVAITGSIEPSGSRTWNIERAAPGFSEAECRPLVLPEAGESCSHRYPLALSNDERWLLVGFFGPGNPSLWLFSLPDGDARLLTPPAELHRGGMFTPDSSLLLVPGGEAMHVWNLAEARWDSAIALPDDACLRREPGKKDNRTHAISPQAPWRVAIGTASGQVCMLDVDRQTANLIVSAEHSSSPHVRWLGNDQLVVQQEQPSRLFLVREDGTDLRQVLP